MCDASLAQPSPPLCGKSHQQQGPPPLLSGVTTCSQFSFSCSSPLHILLPSSPPPPRSFHTHTKERKQERRGSKMERRRKAMWLYPKVVGFNPPERWGHSACFFEGVIYVFGVCIPLYFPRSSPVLSIMPRVAERFKRCSSFFSSDYN
jgi:hypothetical protein